MFAAQSRAVLDLPDIILRLVCVCVRERERERVGVCVCVCVLCDLGHLCKS